MYVKKIKSTHFLPRLEAEANVEKNAVIGGSCLSPDDSSAADLSELAAYQIQNLYEITN